MARSNLIINPTFKVGTADWYSVPVGYGSLARITSDGFFIKTALEITKSSQSSAGVATAALIPVSVGSSYALSAYVKVPEGEEDSGLRVSITWLQSDGTTTVSVSNGATADVFAGDDWIRLAVVATAPSNAVYARVSVVQPTAGTNGKKFLLDAVLLEQSSYVGNFFDDVTQAAENQIVNTGLRPVEYPAVTGMQLNADVQINGLTLNTIDENGIVWVCTGINGWWGLPPSEIQDIPRGLGDGSYDVIGRYAARQIELTGVILPPNSAAVDAARDKLVRAIDLVRRNGWLLTDEAPIKGAQVRISGQPNIEVVNPRGRMEFSIGLRAPDPIKYHWNAEDADGYSFIDIDANSSGTATNIGNTDVTAIFTLTGPFSTGTIIKNTTTGQAIATTTALSGPGAAVGTVEAAERVTVDGVKYATLSLASSYPLAPGDTITVEDVGDDFDGIFEVVEVTVTSSTSLDVTYVNPVLSDFALATKTGTVVLTNAETLEIDTYNRNVFLNSNTIGSRQYLETMIDWIALQPGANTITVADGDTETDGVLEVRFRSGWIG